MLEKTPKNSLRVPSSRRVHRRSTLRVPRPNSPATHSRPSLDCWTLCEVGPFRHLPPGPSGLERPGVGRCLLGPAGARCRVRPLADRGTPWATATDGAARHLEHLDADRLFVTSYDADALTTRSRDGGACVRSCDVEWGLLSLGLLAIVAPHTGRRLPAGAQKCCATPTTSSRTGHLCRGRDASPRPVRGAAAFRSGAHDVDGRPDRSPRVSGVPPNRAATGCNPRPLRRRPPSSSPSTRVLGRGLPFICSDADRVVSLRVDVPEWGCGRRMILLRPYGPNTAHTHFRSFQTPDVVSAVRPGELRSALCAGVSPLPEPGGVCHLITPTRPSGKARLGVRAS